MPDVQPSAVVMPPAAGTGTGGSGGHRPASPGLTKYSAATTESTSAVQPEVSLAATNQ